VATVVVFAGAEVRAQVKPAALFCDHMVVQQGKPVPVWGWADPGESVKITLGTDYAEAVADASGAWSVVLAPMKVQPGNKALELKLKGNGPEVTVHDVLVGEVWLASGQSNMVFQMPGVVNARAEIAAAEHPMVRMFTVQRRFSLTVPKDVEGKWEVAEANKVSEFSAVAYYFAVKLQAALGVPVGIINSSMGGSPVRSWESLDALKSSPVAYKASSDEVENGLHFDERMAQFVQARAAWEDKYGIHDTPLESAKVYPEFTGDDVDMKHWEPTEFPLSHADAQVKSGAVRWFRGSFDVGAAAAGKAQRLDVGPIRESVIAWINGVRVGENGTKATDPLIGDVSFKVDGGLVHAGKNTVVLRTFAHDAALTRFGNAPVTLVTTDGTALKTEADAKWFKRTEVTFPPVDAAGTAAYPVPPVPVSLNTATSLHNAMILPLRDVSIAGAIWYQGESNAGQALYRDELTAMIAEWRAQWHDAWPFYIVQLPNYGTRTDYKGLGLSGWAVTREIEQQVADTVPNSGFAVTIDTGDVTLLHPPNKKPVGERLALLALARVYKLPVAADGPRYVSANFDGDKVRIKLSHADGLTSPNVPLPEFIVAGADKKFYPATAVIDGDALVVSCPEVSKPVAVRYAWSDGPVKADVYNAAGLPLAPFRTDDWPL
jgi:sialate O-acetylesterase